MFFEKRGRKLRTFQIGRECIEKIRENSEGVVVTDRLPRFLPDALLRVQLRAVGREGNKLDPFDLLEIFTKSLMPGRVVPEDRKALSRIPLQEPIQESLGCYFTLFITPHAMFPARMQIERSIKALLCLSGIGLDPNRFASWLPDGR